MNKADALSTIYEAISCLKGASEQVETLSEKAKTQNHGSVKYYRKIIKDAEKAYESLRSS